MKTGMYPDCLRLVMAIPILKKGPKLELGNYRKVIHEKTLSCLGKFNSLSSGEDIEQTMLSLK